MARKVILVADPGIDGAFAAALALFDPELEVLGLVATAGNVPADQATRNVHILVEQLDPPRWPRLGAALPVTYERTATDLHGSGGLGGIEFPCAELHHPHLADKLICDLVRQYPNEVAVVLLGPPTSFARVLDREPEIANLVGRLIVVGGAWHEPGDATAVADFHFHCDPEAARQVLRCGAAITLLPLDVTRKFVLSPGDLLQLTVPMSSPCRFLRRIAPFGVGSCSSLFGVEGLYLNDVFGLMPLALPGAIKTRSVHVDVETRGELTRGQSVFDTRWSSKTRPNVEVVVDVEVKALRDYLQRVLQRDGEDAV
jgi:inosine-uridine nucleoside N-ribohydrolase